jgi:hypothetical protein
MSLEQTLIVIAHVLKEERISGNYSKTFEELFLKILKRFPDQNLYRIRVAILAKQIIEERNKIDEMGNI